MATTLATPGVYIEEKSSFGSSVVPVQTAVPAFVGYTEKANRGSKSLMNNSGCFDGGFLEKTNKF